MLMKVINNPGWRGLCCASLTVTIMDNTCNTNQDYNQAKVSTTLDKDSLTHLHLALEVTYIPMYYDLIYFTPKLKTSPKRCIKNRMVIN